MFCPKCSQRQSSDEMRFCSRCGFPLTAVATLLANDGVIPQLNTGASLSGPYHRKRVMSESAIFTAVTWAIALVTTFWFDVGGPFENATKLAALIFAILGIIGVLRFMYGFLFIKSFVDQSQPDALSGNVSRSVAAKQSKAALPAHRDLVEPDFARRANTKEIAQPSSITENTTRLLED